METTAQSPGASSPPNWWSPIQYKPGRRVWKPLPSRQVPPLRLTGGVVCNASLGEEYGDHCPVAKCLLSALLVESYAIQAWAKSMETTAQSPGASSPSNWSSRIQYKPGRRVWRPLPSRQVPSLRLTGGVVYNTSLGEEYGDHCPVARCLLSV